MSVVVAAKYLRWPVSITYPEHIFNLAEYSADVKQLDILKYGVGFFVVFFWRHCCEVHTAPDTEDEEWDVLTVEGESQLDCEEATSWVWIPRYCSSPKES